jgi:predicted amidohydrolase YtcJ
MIITHAKIYGGPDRTLMDIALESDAIVAVGPTGSLDTTGHEVIDADSRVVMPGLWDEHVHCGLWAQRRRWVDLSPASSAAEAAAIIGEAVRERAHTAGGAVLIGAGYRHGLWTDQKSTALLDSVTGDVPVLLLSVDVHSCWVNTATLRAFTVTGHDVDGSLSEQECFDLTVAVGSVDDNTLDSWTLEAAHAAAARGVVGIVDLDMAYNSVVWSRRAAGVEGRYPLRVEAGVYPEHLERAIAEGLHTGYELAPGISMGPFKIITDGSLNTRTAHCVEPYLGVEGDVRGAMNFDVAEIERLLVRAHQSGFSLAVHAIGDEANRLILEVMAANGLGGRIEHAQLVRDDDFARFAELGVIASVQPEHAVDDRDVTDVYWADRADRAFALRRLVDSGAQLILGSDAPVAPLDPWVSIAAAITRTRDGREPWHPEQSLTLDEAISFSVRNTVAPGQAADLVILDADPRWLVDACGSHAAAASDAVRNMPVWMTISQGVVTHRSSS